MRAKPKPKYALARKLAGHSAMGASLGMLLAFVLLRSHAPAFSEVVTSGTGATVGSVIGSFAIAFALGAVLTGFTFIMEEENREQ
jgi:cytochrome bd-type quinol oxidase subunit 2